MNCERRRPACNSFNAYTGIFIMDGEKKNLYDFIASEETEEYKKKK